VLDQSDELTFVTSNDGEPVFGRVEQRFDRFGVMIGSSHRTGDKSSGRHVAAELVRVGCCLTPPAHSIGVHIAWPMEPGVEYEHAGKSIGLFNHLAKSDGPRPVLNQRVRIGRGQSRRGVSAPSNQSM
jgi:hypothetical protein